MRFGEQKSYFSDIRLNYSMTIKRTLMTTYNGPIIRPSLMPLGAVHHSRNKSSRNKSRDRRRSKEEEATFQTGMCQSRKIKIKVLQPGGWWGRRLPLSSRKGIQY